MHDPPRQELGDFLRSRRARLRPEDVGLPTCGGQRRVPGLRREELAQPAGVSARYYTRLEQGQSPNASAAVHRRAGAGLRAFGPGPLPVLRGVQFPAAAGPPVCGNGQPPEGPDPSSKVPSSPTR
ncbi:helix-turn-helix transcriptional regulator [Streptomyces sp. CB01881]|uniref:helix-turn-helix domain-containing protein n=1 Tax=Streptomyces sp. CB01881 TaxID=2078691 RepID=UPI0023F8BA76|nr:helix-turn-helix transcriptional regulator [Streptomyces sp. CB01881]